MANTGGIRAGKAFVEIGTDNTALERGLRAAGARLKAFGASVKAVGVGMFAAGAAVVAPLLGAVKVFAETGDQLDEMSQRTGVSVEALSELGFAAEQSGADLDTLEAGLRKMQRGVTDAATGSGAATEALARLGLGVQDVVQLSPEEQFKLIADRLAGIADPTLRAALAMELFGKSGTRLLPMLAGGAAGIEALRAEARALGIVFTAKMATDAALLADTLNKLWRVVKICVVAVGAELAPTLIEYANTIKDVIIRVTAWIRKHGALIVNVGKVAVVVAAAGTALVGLGIAASVAAVAMKGFAAALVVYRGTAVLAAVATTALNATIGLLIANPVVAAIVAVAAVVGAIGLAAASSKWQVDRLDTSLNRVVSTTTRDTKRAQADAGEAEETAAGQDRQVENWARNVHQLRIAQIEDEHQRAVATINERYAHELSEAQRVHAAKDVLARIEEARGLEIAAANADAAEKQAQVERQGFDDYLASVHELNMLRIEGVEDAHARELAAIRERFRYAQELAERRGAGPEVRHNISVLEAAEVELANAREALRLRASASAIAERDADRVAQIAELELRTKYKGVELEEKLLDLQEQRALAAAEAVGENLELVRQEFDLRRRLAEVSATVDRAGVSVTGTFSAIAVAGLGSGRTETLLRAIEKNTRKSAESDGPTFGS